MENPKFLKEKYNLHNTPEVDSAAKRTGEKVPQNPEKRIQNYLDRLERLALDPDKEQKRKMLGDESRPRGLMLLREMVMNKYVRSHKEKMAEGAARVEERAARELGIDVHYGEQELAQRGEIAVEDLEKSLDNWILYLSDANEPYPVWFRYYVFRNILDLGDYDKDKGEFTKRSEGTIRLFPEIDRGALAYVQDIIESSKDSATLERLRNAQETAGTPKDQLVTKEKAANFAKLSFAKQYVEGIKQAGEITPEMREEVKGKWVKYQKGTDPTALWASLQNKGTAWCTKGFATAETQLKGGDFYVYYTYDKQGKPAIPRIAIRMQEDSIAEVRGVADNVQNLEGKMVDIAGAKMKELPGAERYRKISADMKYLTLVEKKAKTGQQLNKDDLTFLYEINSSIEGFGYQTDPRIAELRAKRNPEEDMFVVLDCSKEQVAHTASEITESTKAYLGPLEPGIFDAIQQHGIEQVFTSFPEGKIRKFEAVIGGQTSKELQKELKEKKINLTNYSTDTLNSKEFTTLKNPEQIDLVCLKVRDLGFKNGATTDEIYSKAKKLGLELCPAEVGPHLRIQYLDQPLGEWLWIAMKQITDRVGYPDIFDLGRSEDGLWLSDNWARPGGRWHAEYEFVFSFRKLKS
ncbi:MAG: hypothetical protein G01um101444_507 [Parcubacteria group bacterium Gr01-1014_44]|nr:MAG: hypothetical protein G01um101444_507 [Parcubacteria group bacterium Gr01-1014_44]